MATDGEYGVLISTLVNVTYLRFSELHHDLAEVVDESNQMEPV